MLGGNCTEALSNQATVTFSGSIAKLIENGIAPLPFPLPALLNQSWYIKRGERVRVRGHAPFYATLGSSRQEGIDDSFQLAVQIRRALDAVRIAPLLAHLGEQDPAILIECRRAHQIDDRFQDSTDGPRPDSRSRARGLDSALVLAPGELDDAVEEDNSLVVPAEQSRWVFDRCVEVAEELVGGVGHEHVLLRLQARWRL